jgi:hypothetical protein
MFFSVMFGHGVGRGKSQRRIIAQHAPIDG